MKITILGGGNIGSAIALGLADSSLINPGNINVVDIRREPLDNIHNKNSKIITLENDYSSVASSDIVIIAVKPWIVEDTIHTIKNDLNFEKQIIISVAATVTFDQLNGFLEKEDGSKPSLFRVIPNTAIEVKQSMTVIATQNSTTEQVDTVMSLFNTLGKAMLINESQMPAATALVSCGIAYALRYIRAAMEGGVEMGFYPSQAKEMVAQTVLGAAKLIFENNSHPEVEIDKVTTPGGLTIKGVNEMEHAGFTSSVIKGLKSSVVKEIK